MFLYIHVPFCRRKCLYCGFYSQAGNRAAMKRYCQGLRRQATWLTHAGLLSAASGQTVFFGGGTPTALPIEELTGLLRELGSVFTCERIGEHDIDLDSTIKSSPTIPEITIEANPATIDEQIVCDLRRAGCNRLSLGVQSFHDKELRALGRLHSAADGRLAVHQARAAGITNLSLDLMYGLPGQTLGDWHNSLEQALVEEPEHLSLYELTIEEGTDFARRYALGELALPSEEEVLAMMELTTVMTRAAGLVRYEISSYARPGRECLHNLNYWDNGMYLGLGPGAVSCLADGRRCRAPADLDGWLKLLDRGGPGWIEEEQLDQEARFRETVVLGLRMIRGVSLATLRQRFDIDAREYYGGLLERLIQHDLLRLRGEYLQLTEKGLPLANRVMAELV